jgi:hypothetical protein
MTTKKDREGSRMTHPIVSSLDALAVGAHLGVTLIQARRQS